MSLNPRGLKRLQARRQARGWAFARPWTHVGEASKILTFLVRTGVPMQTWQMQEAKARLSELVKTARQCGPQDISVHGRTVAVVLSKEDFDRLSGTQLSLSAFIAASPWAEVLGDADLPARLSDAARQEDW